jgi:hypothetical protein
MRYALYELIQQINDIWGTPGKVQKLHEIDCPQLRTLFDLCFNPNIKWLINPKQEYKPLDESESTMRTRLYTEARKLGTFVSSGPYPGLKEEKRNTLWQTLLETIHPKDAELMLHIARWRSLPGGKVNKKVLAEAFPTLAKNWGTEKGDDETK